MSDYVISFQDESLSKTDSRSGLEGIRLRGSLQGRRKTGEGGPPLYRFGEESLVIVTVIASESKRSSRSNSSSNSNRII